MPTLVGGAPGAVWGRDGRPMVAFDFTIRDGKMVQIEMVGDAERLHELAVTLPAV